MDAVAPVETNKRKRGVLNVDEYQRNHIKKSRIKGTRYTNYKGNVMQGKTIGAPCTCRLKCFTKLIDEGKTASFRKFYSLESKDEQDIYLQGLMNLEPIKHRRPRQAPVADGNVRNSSFTYNIVCVDGVRKKICKRAFLSLHDISNKRLQRLQLLLRAGDTPKDKRGQQVSGNALPAEEKIRITEHISSYPAKSSHYLTREYHYLDSNLTAKTMYSMFLQKYPDTKIKYDYYSKVFRENFNLKFGRQQQVDVCCECESLSLKIKSKQLNDNAKRVATAEMIVHKRRSKKFYTALQESTKKSKNNDNVLALSFDYMQNLQLPKVPTQDLFYLRQLTVSVFCVHNMKTNEVVYFIYHEGIAKKWPNKVCSFLTEYIDKYVPKTVKELHIFSDNCPGQNKNNTMIRMCLYLTDSGRFDKIEQYFPIRGHSFLPCDRDFGLVKRALKKVDRVYILHQYVEILAMCSSKQNIKVHVIDGKNIINFKDWWLKLYKKTAISTETSQRGIPRNQKVHFNISTFHHFSYESQTGTVVTSEFINSMVNHTFCLKLAINLKRPEEIANPTGKVPIKTEKMEHIKKSAVYIDDHESTSSFWKYIFEWPTLQ